MWKKNFIFFSIVFLLICYNSSYSQSLKKEVTYNKLHVDAENNIRNIVNNIKVESKNKEEYVKELYNKVLNFEKISSIYDKQGDISGSFGYRHAADRLFDFVEKEAKDGNVFAIIRTAQWYTFKARLCRKRVLRKEFRKFQDSNDMIRFEMSKEEDEEEYTNKAEKYLSMLPPDFGWALELQAMIYRYGLGENIIHEYKAL